MEAVPLPIDLADFLDRLLYNVYKVMGFTCWGSDRDTACGMRSYGQQRSGGQVRVRVRNKADDRK